LFIKNAGNLINFSYYEKNSFYNFDFRKSFKLGIVVLVMLYKMLVIVLLSTFTLDMSPDPKTKFVPISNTRNVRNGPTCQVLILEIMSPAMHKRENALLKYYIPDSLPSLPGLPDG